MKDLNTDPVYMDSQWSKADTLGVGEEETQKNLEQWDFFPKEEQFFLQLEVCLDWLGCLLYENKETANQMDWGLPGLMASESPYRHTAVTHFQGVFVYYETITTMGKVLQC